MHRSCVCRPTVVIDPYDYQLPASMRQIRDTNAAKIGRQRPFCSCIRVREGRGADDGASYGAV